MWGEVSTSPLGQMGSASWELQPQDGSRKVVPGVKQYGMGENQPSWSGEMLLTPRHLSETPQSLTKRKLYTPCPPQILNQVPEKPQKRHSEVRF